LKWKPPESDYFFSRESFPCLSTQWLLGFVST
jgi:hypothetical protein